MLSRHVTVEERFTYDVRYFLGGPAITSRYIFSSWQFSFVSFDLVRFRYFESAHSLKAEINEKTKRDILRTTHLCKNWTQSRANSYNYLRTINDSSDLHILWKTLMDTSLAWDTRATEFVEGREEAVYVLGLCAQKRKAGQHLKAR